MALTEDELDEVCDRLRRKFGAGIFSAAGTSRKEQVRSLSGTREWALGFVVSNGKLTGDVLRTQSK